MWYCSNLFLTITDSPRLPLEPYSTVVENVFCTYFTAEVQLFEGSFQIVLHLVSFGFPVTPQSVSSASFLFWGRGVVGGGGWRYIIIFVYLKWCHPNSLF